MDLPSLTNALKFFEESFSQGHALLGSDAVELLKLLVVLEVIFGGIYLALGTQPDMKNLAKKVLVIGFFYWVVTNYQSLLQSVVDGFLYAGARGGGGSAISFASLQDPDAIFRRGINLLTPIVNKLYASGAESYFNLFTADSAILLFTIVTSLVSFALIAVHVFITYLEYLLVTAVGLVLLPFGVFRPTGFLAERVFGAIIGYGVKLMVLALIVGVSDRFLQSVAIPETVTWEQAFEFMTISMALGVLSLHAPSAALGLLSASPQLSIGALTSTSRLASSINASPAGLTKSVAPDIKRAGNAGALLAGTIAGGASAAMTSNQENSRSPLMSGLNTTFHTATAPLQAMGSNFAERMTYGKAGSATGKRQTIMAHGYSHNEGGLSGAFRRGQFAIPGYRRAHPVPSMKNNTPKEQ